MTLKPSMTVSTSRSRPEMFHSSSSSSFTYNKKSNPEPRVYSFQQGIQRPVGQKSWHFLQRLQFCFGLYRKFLVRIPFENILYFHFREFLNSLIVKNWANNNENFFLISCLFGQFREFRKRNRWAVNARHAQAF